MEQGALDQSLKSGTKLGRYTIVEPLGAGGMGVVYRGRDEKLERDVAIKLLLPGIFVTDKARHRFRKEALALAKLSHAHIATIYDVGEQDGLDYIVMECVPGESLAMKLAAGPLAVQDATAIASQIAEALEEAHEHGVIHRDLKPGNVIVTPKGQVKVLDFGLAKLLEADRSVEATVSFAETRGIIGTPLYMSPEQAEGRAVDARTDLWSLGALYYESLAGRAPFHGDSGIAVLRAIVEEPPKSVHEFRADAPALAGQIVQRALEKDLASRYQTAAEFRRDTSTLLAQLSTPSSREEKPQRLISPVLAAAAAVLLLAVGTAALWQYQRSAKKHWAREDAIPRVNNLLEADKSLAAFLVLQEARKDLPADSKLKQIADENTRIISVQSTPPGASVEIKDYLTPDAAWYVLGTTPLENVRVPKGYFRWRVSKKGMSALESAPLTDQKMEFALDAAQKTPEGMVLVGGGAWQDFIDFVGWVGPYQLPAFYFDRKEVTNRDYQKFVDAGGYDDEKFWAKNFVEDGRTVPREQAMAQFRDTTGRTGPATWVAGHYPQGQADFPVAGVSWFEASAYAAWAGKSLPVLSQWFRAAPTEAAAFAVRTSNISRTEMAAAEAFPGLGPYGTYDLIGNAREWVENPVDQNLRFLLGGSWKSQSYLATDPEALPPFDRSDTNGFRCVKNIEPLPAEAANPVNRSTRDFTKAKPVSDEVFHAYELLYAYPQSPLHAKAEGVVADTADWREEKVTFDAAYRNERMTAYLFLPKHVKPPYQTVLFSPSARVLWLTDSSELGDVKFFNYVVQSGRAVIYPIYQGTYERQGTRVLPNAGLSLEFTAERYKDAARSLDYLATRPDIDNTKLAYLGVSMGSAQGVIFTTLMQERLKTVVFLDGGFFLDTPAAGEDQVDFAPRLKKPVLMVNGRYDFSFSLEHAQNPLFAMLGTPEADKRHVVLDTPHDVTEKRPELVRAVLDWLDEHLGRVNE